MLVNLQSINEALKGFLNHLIMYVEVELPGGSTWGWESYPHDSQGVSKAKLKQRFTDLTKAALL